MRSGICAFLCLVAFAPIAFAQTFDKAKFRQAIELPALSANYGVNYKASERDGKGFKFDPAQKIADLQKKLTGAPDDAEVYLEMRMVYRDCLKDEKRATELLEKAEALLRPFMKTTDPKQGNLLIVYATALEIMAKSPWSDCEAWARRAVSVAPQDWRTWSYLAHARHQQIPTILCGGDDSYLSKDRRTQEVIGALHLHRFRPEHVDEAEKALNEARQHSDKAKQLAPNDPKRQEQRYGFRLTEIVIRNAICVYRNQKPLYPRMQLERELLDELQECARLHADHLLWQSQLAHQLIVLGWQDAVATGHKDDKVFRPARPEDREAIRQALDNIEALAAASQGDTAIYCYSMLAALDSSMLDHVAAEKHARKILQYDPKNQMAAEQLQSSLVFQGRKADAMQAAQTLKDAVSTARNYFLLAKAFALNERDDLAQNACLAGLQLDPTDVYCLLGTAAMVMRRGDDPQSLKTAADLLERAKRECRPNAGVNQFTEHDYLAAIHQALSGDTAFARIRLERMQSENPSNPRYAKILVPLGR